MGAIPKTVIIVLIGAAMWPFGIRTDLSSPVATMRTFQKAIHAEDWTVAAACLSNEIKKRNANMLYKNSIYTTSYWQPGRGMESFLKEAPPLIEKKCTFKVLHEDQMRATVEFVYPRHREKVVRLKTITLERDLEGSWKISEIFGRITPDR